MKKLGILLAAVVLLAVISAPVMAQSGHKDLNGCQAGPNNPTHTVDVGYMLGFSPSGILVEALGACCVRGDYTSPIDNGFPGGCCKHPWLEPGSPPTSNPPAFVPPLPTFNPHPGNRDNPTDPPQVGYVCQCGTIRIE